MASKIEIFFCYAHEDELLRQGLEKHLKIMQRQGLIDLWYDRNISAGIEWEREIDSHLNKAQIFLLLISPDFMDSDYCYGVEMQRAMKRHEYGETCVIPVILRPVHWQDAPFGKLQILPEDAKPVMSSSWYSIDEAFFNVAEGIRKVIKALPVQSKTSNTSISTYPSDSSAQSRDNHTAHLGEIFEGKFKTVQVLHEGGLRTTYKVEMLGSPDYYYAVIKQSFQSNEESQYQASINYFNKQIDILREIKHPRIPSLLYPFQEKGSLCYLREYVNGRGLHEILEENKGPLGEEQVINWMMEACEALSYIHSRIKPIIHRDLKPSSFIVTPSNYVYLVGFDIARRFDPNKRTNTENLGTISFASPEHLGSLRERGSSQSMQHPGRLVQTDPRSDIYSLGATMYLLLTNNESAPIVTPTIGSISVKNPQLRTIYTGDIVVCPIEQVIIKAMQQDPTRRFQSAQAMRTALQYCLSNYSS